MEKLVSCEQACCCIVEHSVCLLLISLREFSLWWQIFLFFLSSNNNLMLEQNWSGTLESISYTVPLTSISIKEGLISFKGSFRKSLPTCSHQSGNSGQKHTVQHSKFRASVIHQSHCLCDILLNCEYAVSPTGWECVTFTANLLASVPVQSICASHSNWF